MFIRWKCKEEQHEGLYDRRNGFAGQRRSQGVDCTGHQVKAIALPPLPQGAVLPPEMEITYGNYLEMTDDEVRDMFTGCEGFVFAAGVDERVEGPAPIYDLFKKYNIDFSE